MKWLEAMLLLWCIQSATTAHLDQRSHARNHIRKQHHKSAVTTAPNLQSRNNAALRQRQRPEVPSLSAASSTSAEPQLEIDMLQCPLGCVCQYAQFADLPISRWINHMQMRQPDAAADDDAADALDNEANSNEVIYDNDSAFLTNPFMKQATCILQEDNNVEKLINTLPHDLHALILLYTGVGHNKTINLSILKPLNQLVTLEIRGGPDRSLRISFDEPLAFMQHANFESITLLGSEEYKRPKNPVHPSDSFDYKPRSEVFEDADDDGILAFAAQKQDNDIVPYDVYIQEVKKARTPTFYGWEHLEVLRIHGCELNELQWEMFDGLQALQHLSLERNGIMEVPAFSFYGAMHIRTLSLAHNRIHDLHYRALAGLLKLELLDLSDNRLEKLSERSFPPFPKLLNVNFEGNPIRYILPASFWVMNSTHAMAFDAAEHPLELKGNQPFESLLHLETLTIGNVLIGNLEQNIFKGLVSLEKLTLKGRIRRIEFDAFAGLSRLRELEMNGCSIQELSMDAFIGCKSLEIVDLSNNNLSYIPQGLFDDQIHLEEIYLQGNQLRTLPLNFFLQPKLRLARLNDNPWQCNCDMNNWHPKITNQERGPRTKRCITDYNTGKQISCRRVDTYKYDNRYAPRCSSHNERSVFYVLRKQLQCGPGRIVTSHNKQPTPHWRKLQQSGLKVQHDGRKQHTNWRIQKDITRGGNQNAMRPIRKGAGIQHNIVAQRNTLDYVLQQERLKRVRSHNADDDEQNLSNEI